jgi:hypothetical protein
LNHRIDILPRPNGQKHGPEPIAYHGKEIAKTREPILAASRWLLDNNAAFPNDTIEVYRNGKLSMSGIVGKLAKLTVHENDKGLRLTRWMPFLGAAVAPETTKTAEDHRAPPPHRRRHNGRYPALLHIARCQSHTQPKAHRGREARLFV